MTNYIEIGLKVEFLVLIPTPGGLVWEPWICQFTSERIGYIVGKNRDNNISIME